VRSRPPDLRGRWFHYLVTWTTCANLQQNRFIYRYIVVLKILVHEIDNGPIRNVVPLVVCLNWLRHKRVNFLDHRVQSEPDTDFLHLRDSRNRPLTGGYKRKEAFAPVF